MATFSPPVKAYYPRGNNASLAPADRLFRHYSPVMQGVTVWKDTLGVWHEQMFPPQGGIVHTVHDGPNSTYSAPSEGLATAEKVFLGGHTYEIASALEELELQIQGYSLGGHALSREQLWVDYALAAVDNRDAMSGDAFAMQPFDNNGAVLAIMADNTIGTSDADGYFLTSGISRNAVFLLTAGAAAISGQILPGGGPTPLVHPTGGHWWWPLDLTLDGSGSSAVNNILVGCLHLAPGAGFGEFLGNQIVRLTLFGTSGAFTEVPVWGTSVQLNTIVNGSTHHYIFGATGHTGDVLQALNTVARAPLDDLDNPSAWEVWNGSAWVSSGPFDVIRDHINRPIFGSSTFRERNGKWICAQMPNIYSSQVVLYISDNPQGPYKQFAEATHDRPLQGLASDPKTRGGQPRGGRFAYYQPKFQEFLDPAENMVLSYNRNSFSFGILTGGASDPEPFHVSVGCPQFVYLPIPE